MENKFINIINKNIKNSVWTGYVHTYPHKKAYTPLLNINMEKVWKNVKELNLYVHIPFCDRKCAYCNLFSTVLCKDKKVKIYNDYVEKLLKEIDYYSKYIDKNVKILSLYFGGGTPNVLTTEQLSQIICKFKSTFKNFDKNIEICIESSPDRLNEEYIKDLINIGVKRVSIGVQSFIQNELNIVGRRFDVTYIDKVVDWFKKYGMKYNIDLIYGLPYQTKETIMFNIDKVISLSPDNICVYPLAIRKCTAMDNIDKSSMFTNEQKYNIYNEIREKLEKSNYLCQTIVRFTKKDDNCTYQQQRYEYKGVSTLGIGAGARSYAPNLHYCITYKVKDGLVKNIIEEYMNTETSSLNFTGYKFNEKELKRKSLMLSMLDPGISADDYKKRFNSNPLIDFKKEFEALIKLNMIQYNNDTKLYELTRKGRQYSDICADIFVSDKVHKLYKKYVVE
jgi:oxygen-independent coproporphyrinogen III oxidase